MCALTEDTRAYVFARVQIKRALVEGDENSTTLVLKSLRNTERVYKNEAARQVQEIEKVKPGSIEAIRHIVSGENYRKSFHETGDTQNSVWSAGQVMGLIDDVPRVATLVETLMRDAVAAAHRASSACMSSSGGANALMMRPRM